MSANNLVDDADDEAGDGLSSSVKDVAVKAGSAGIALPTIAALPEAFEKHPYGGGMVAGLFVVWLIYRIIIALINRPPRT